MIRIKLAEDDRVKLELPEWIELDLNRPKLSEIRRLKAEVEWEWSRLEADVDKLDDRDVMTAARAVMCWLAVNRVRPVSWEEFDLDVFGVEYEVVDPNPSAPDGAET